MSKVHVIYSEDCNTLRIYADEEVDDSSNVECHALQPVPKEGRIIAGCEQKGGWNLKRLKSIARQVWDIDQAIEQGRVQFHHLKQGEGYRLVEPQESF